VVVRIHGAAQRIDSAAAPVVAAAFLYSRNEDHD